MTVGAWAGAIYLFSTGLQVLTFTMGVRPVFLGIGLTIYGIALTVYVSIWEVAG